MEGLFFTAIVLVIGMALLPRWTSSPEFKGWLGEARVHRILEMSLAHSKYTILRDVTLDAGDGTTQIDHIVASTCGIFVIETKNMSGWIFGSERNAKWTQTFHRSKVQFQNPLRQNYGHIKALENLLKLDSSKFHSVVVFTGSATFKTAIPPNVVTLGRLVSFIQNKTIPLIRYDEVKKIVEIIESSRRKPGLATNAAHIKSLKVTSKTVSGTLEDARSLMRHGVTALIAVKAVAGIVAIGVLLLFGSMFLKNLKGLVSNRTAVPSSYVVEQSPMLEASNQSSASATRAAGSKPRLFSNTQAYIAKLQKEQADRQKQTEIDKQLAWKASLMCGYSSDTMRCACYEPKGGKVKMKFDACKALADKGTGIVRLR